MNVLFILCDTLVRNKLSPYHQGQGPYGHIRTPNLERLAKRSATFTNHWINSAPCMPARRDLWSGRIEFPWRSWGPRESFDPDWTRTLRETKVNTALFTDHANLFDVGAGNYHFFFDHYEFIRGHYNDHCCSCPPVDPARPGHWRTVYEDFRRTWDSEEQSFVARNLTNVADWLDAHAAEAQPFFVFVDEFDPHWPLDPPEPYRSMYLEDTSLADNDFPTFYHGTKAEAYGEDELTWLNAQCASKITMVDHWLGTVFDQLDEHDLWDDTLVILTTDHGEFIGEHAQMSKGGGFSYPLFANIPLIMHCPGSPQTGEQCDALTCAVDLHATTLDALGKDISPHCHGRSLLPVLQGDVDGIRQEVLYGWWGKGFYWTDGKYLVCKAPEQPGPLYQYGTDFGEKWVGLRSESFDRYANAETGRFLSHTDRPVCRVPMDGMAYNNPHADFDALFDLQTDPQCQQNLCATQPELWRQCLQKLRAAMEELGVPVEHVERLGLDT